MGTRPSRVAEREVRRLHACKRAGVGGFGRFFFFFSSRRRHTRCLSDWSSDVCSSDLPPAPGDWPKVIRKPNRCTGIDRKSTRLNSSHLGISYAVFCLKKKTKTFNRIGKGPNTSAARIERLCDAVY